MGMAVSLSVGSVDKVGSLLSEIVGVSVGSVGLCDIFTEGVSLISGSVVGGEVLAITGLNVGWSVAETVGSLVAELGDVTEPSVGSEVTSLVDGTSVGSKTVVGISVVGDKLMTEFADFLDLRDDVFELFAFLDPFEGIGLYSPILRISISLSLSLLTSSCTILRKASLNSFIVGEVQKHLADFDIFDFLVLFLRFLESTLSPL